MSEDEKDDNYVGYKHPPKATRFKKGQSGNPKGRTKTTKNISDIITKELLQVVSVKIHGRICKMQRLQLMIRQLSDACIKGCPKAFKELMSLTEKYKVFARAEFTTAKNVELGKSFFSELMADFEHVVRYEKSYGEMSVILGEDLNTWFERNKEKLETDGFIKSPPDEFKMAQWPSYKENDDEPNEPFRFHGPL